MGLQIEYLKTLLYIDMILRKVNNPEEKDLLNRNVSWSDMSLFKLYIY